MAHSMRALRGAGCRLTRPRRTVVEVLAGSDVPLTPYGLQKLVKAQGQRLDHVTAYRVLELLQRLGLVHRVPSSGGFMRCTLEGEGVCHRYLLCKGCGRVQEFADESLCMKEDELASRLGFRAEHHVAESSGLCSACHD